MSTLKLIGGMALIVVIGAPMVWYLWEVLTQILSWELEVGTLLIAIPVLLVFLAFLWFVSRTIRGWEERWSS